MKKLARAALNLTLLSIVFCISMVIVSYIIYQIYNAQNPLPTPVLAPQDVPVISSPQELSDIARWELENKMLWSENHANLIRVADGQPVEIPNFPDPNLIGHFYFSGDGRYIVYDTGSFGASLKILDTQTGDAKVLVQAQEISDTNTTLFDAISFSPDNRYIVFAVYGENLADLVKYDLTTHTWRRLHVNVLLGGIGTSNIFPDGKILITHLTQI
jgi:hypothetical protein